MLLDDLIYFIFVVQVDALPGQLAVDIFVKILELFNDALYTECNLVVNVRGLRAFIEGFVNCVKQRLDFLFLGGKFRLDEFHFFLPGGSDLLFPLDWSPIQIF